MTITYNIVKRSTYGNQELSSFELRGQWGYCIRKTGKWKRASYVTIIGGHTIELKIAEPLKHRGSNQFGIAFSVDGSEAEVSAAKGKPGIGRWLLAAWKQVLLDYPGATFTCVPYSKDGNSSTRESWYCKLGFKGSSDSNVLFYS